MKKIKQLKNKTNKHSSVTYQGLLDISRQGMGFVKVSGQDIDIIVRRDNLKGAMQSDEVEVSLIQKSKTAKRKEGIVTRIIRRGISELVGTVELNQKYAFVVPDNPSFGKDIFINPTNSQNLQNGDRVIVKITQWSENNRNPEGIITDILDASKSGDIAMKDILLQHGFSLSFPEEVIRESEQLPSEIHESEIQGRRDMRKVFTLTIDPHDAKDFDDAISFQKLENGQFEIGVHIADVSHFVKPGTALDQEAYKRATSVYLPDRVLPMLPEKISNGLCSLRPLEDKLTFSAVFIMNDQAEVLSQWMGRTAIHSNRRYTYEEAQAIIDGQSDEYAEIILKLNAVSQKLRQQKFKDGAINFSSDEARFILDEFGVPTGVEIKENTASHQLIEELMLLANRKVAAFVSNIQFKNKAIPFPYRIHDSPDLDKLKPFAAFAAQFGHRFDLSSPQAIAKSFNRMVENSSGKPDQDILHTLGIRTMAKAVYATDNIGHYGLAFEHYCHFTSPIRRYPDVLVHRILQECIDQQIHPIENMNAQCTHCSERERKAMDAERDGQKYKQVEWMLSHVGEEFEASISGVAPFGFWAVTNEHRCEGLISAQQMEEEFEFLEAQYTLVGRRTKNKFRIGQQIKIRIAAANLVKRQIDMEWIGNL